MKTRSSVTYWKFLASDGSIQLDESCTGYATIWDHEIEYRWRSKFLVPIPDIKLSKIYQL